MQVGSWCCGEYGEQLFVEIEEDEATPVSINFTHDANCSQISVVTVTFPKIEKVFQIVVYDELVFSVCSCLQVSCFAICVAVFCSLFVLLSFLCLL